jgi:hypothetical protein
MMMNLRTLVARTASVALFMMMSGCATSAPIKTQDYAKLKNTRTFEFEFPMVWNGIETAFKGYKIADRDPDDVDAQELKKLRQRTLETDWIYTQSRDKYIEYKVNDLPKKKYLQTRVKYDVEARSVIGGTEVKVLAKEEVERLKADGAPDGYTSVDPDSSRSNEVLDRINLAILSAAP